jgi:hypothetical protein
LENDASAKIVIIGEGGRREELLSVSGAGDSERVSNKKVDLSHFAGQTVTLRMERINESQVVLDKYEITFDTDGDGLSDNVEKNGIRIGDGEVIYTNPYKADTDGDGLTDGQEVGVRTNTGDSRDRNSPGIYDNVDGGGGGGGPPAGYYELTSDPTEADSDGDGLSDYEEVYEWWTVVTTQSKRASKRAVSERDSVSPEEAVKRYEVQTDPLYADTDGDRVPDEREILLNTDPTAYDTDKDGASDGAELYKWGTDPTLHDIKPPEVTVTQVKTEGNITQGTDYQILYEVSDPSGVRAVRFRKNGETVETERFRGVTRKVSEAKFHIGAIESNIDTLTGTAVKVRAEDWNGVEGETSAYERANFAGSIAEKLGKNGIKNEYVAGNLGYLSGFAVSLGGTARDLKQSGESVLATIEQPSIIVEGIKKFVDVLREYGVLELLVSFVKSTLGSVVDKQDTNNPYGKETNEHLVYEGSWYTGYVGGMLVKTVASGGVSKLAKSNTYVQRVRKVVKKTPPGRLASYVATKRANAKAKVAGQLVRGTKYAGGKVIGGAKTVGSAVRTKGLLRRADVETDDLSKAEAENVQIYLARGGEEAADDIDDEDVDDAFSIFDQCRSGVGTATSVIALQAREECEVTIPPEEDGPLYIELEKKDVDGDELADELDQSTIDEVKRLIKESDEGAGIVVNAHKYSDARGVPDPGVLADDINSLLEKGVNIHTLSELSGKQKNKVMGHSQEIYIGKTLSSKFDSEDIEVAAIGKTFYNVEIKEEFQALNGRTKVSEVELDVIVKRKGVDRDREGGVYIVESKNEDLNWNPPFTPDRVQKRIDEIEREVRATASIYDDRDIPFRYYTAMSEDEFPDKIEDAVKELREEGFNVRIVYNSGYENE